MSGTRTSVIPTENELSTQVARALERKGFHITREAKVNPFLDAHADIYAQRPDGPRLVVEVKRSPNSVSVEAVQQVQQYARLLGESSHEPVLGLVVSPGPFTPGAEYYAGAVTPRVYLATREGLSRALDRIIRDWPPQ